SARRRATVRASLSPNGRSTYQGSGAAIELFIGTTEGIFIGERDGRGAAWRLTGRALEGMHVSSVLVEPERGGIFAGIHTGRLYASLDGGRTWERITRALPAEPVYPVNAPTRDGQVVLYVGTEPPPLVQSFDYGETGQELPALLAVEGYETWDFPGPPHLAHV